MKGFIIMLMSLFMFCAMTIASEAVQGTDFNRTEYITTIVEADSPVDVYSYNYFVTNCPIEIDVILDNTKVPELVVEPIANNITFTEVTFIWPNYQVFNDYSNNIDLICLEEEITTYKFQPSALELYYMYRQIALK